MISVKELLNALIQADKTWAQLTPGEQEDTIRLLGAAARLAIAKQQREGRKT